LATASQSVLQRLRDATTERYDRLPAPLQDVLCSVYGVQELVRRRGLPGSARRRMQEIEALHWDREAAQRLAEAKLRRMLALARSLPGYAAHAPSVSASSAFDDLAAWTPLTKEEIRRWPEAYLTREPHSRDIFSLTSGTSGTPLRVWRPREAFRELFRSSDVSKTWFGIPLGGRRATFTGKIAIPIHSHRVWRLNLPGRQMVLSQYHVGPRTVRLYSNALAGWRPYVLDGYTSTLVELAKLFQDQGISVHIPLVVTTCEVLTASGRALLERTFQGRVADKYGSTENLVLATECPSGSRHIFQNVGIIEVVDDESRPLPAGEPGRLLLTTLTNDLMPLVRYEIGDMGAYDDVTPCPCGRTSPLLREIHGRQDDVIIARDGRRIGIFAFQLLRGVEGVVQMQVVQEDVDSFRVRAVLERDAAEGRARFEPAIRKAFDRMMGKDPGRSLNFDYEQRIERAPGGKIRNVIRTF
jgi:phenylacetate-CoA ligase